MEGFFKIAVIVAGLLLIPFGGHAGAQITSGMPPPPAAQPLVREGDFAMQLAESLYLGYPQNDADAENKLQSIGIAPKYGWISDYPVTPDILMALENAVEASAESRQLALEKGEALQIFGGVAGKFGLPLSNTAPGTEAQSGESPTPYNDVNPAWLNAYYDENGPPVITYYPPPPAYLALYAWVPYPFWYTDYFFKGYYCLRDFDRTVFVEGVSKACTNHITDQDTGQVFIINPVTKQRGKFYKMESGPYIHRERRDAAMIHRRHIERDRREHMEHRYYMERSNRIEYRDPVHHRGQDGVKRGGTATNTAPQVRRQHPQALSGYHGDADDGNIRETWQ